MFVCLSISMCWVTIRTRIYSTSTAKSGRTETRIILKTMMQRWTVVPTCKSQTQIFSRRFQWCACIQLTRDDGTIAFNTLQLRFCFPSSRCRGYVQSDSVLCVRVCVCVYVCACVNAFHCSYILTQVKLTLKRHARLFVGIFP